MTENGILLVEDNPDDAELTLIAFRELKVPWPVVVARDGVEALDYLFARGKHAGRKKTDTPVLIVLDLKLPKLDGLEVLRAIRADPLLKFIVVIVLTSSTEEADRTEALRLGTNLYFRKPLEFDETMVMARNITRLLSMAR